MGKAKPYYAEGALSALHYDVVTAADARVRGDEAVYVDLAKPGASILELGAGTGRLTCDLARRGFNVTGVDIAAAMLAQARERVAGLDPEVAARVTLRLGDLTALDLKRTFDLPGGLFAVHLPRLEVMQRLSPLDPKAMVMDQPMGDGRRLRLYVRER
eukprot:gene14776-19547_t